MKKILTITIFFFFILIWIPICQANFGVSPLELSISMNEKFIHGNTFEEIKIINNNDFSLNVSWYLDHPTPIDWMRHNKTVIPDLSWIDLEPKWKIIPPHSSAPFLIILNIPEKEENLNQHWETWITFKAEENQFIKIENAVRFYIDTPTEMSIMDNQDQGAFSIKIGDQISLSIFDLAIIIIIITLLVIGILVFKKKKL